LSSTLVSVGATSSFFSGAFGVSFCAAGFGVAGF